MTINMSPKRKEYSRQAFLANISTGWKMTLMVFVLFLGILGITLSAYSGLQSLRYQLSNIYDFMLVPIVAINNADAALANAQYSILQTHSEDLSATEHAHYADSIASENQTAQDVIQRYDTEWVTTVSPEFTQALRDGGKLALQEQEVSTLAGYHTAYDAYLTSLDKYLATVRSGNPDTKLANQAIENLITARAHLQELIVINNQYADFSNELAQNTYGQALLSGGIVLAVAVVLGLVLSYLISVSITNRLSDLTTSATAMQAGNLDQTVAVVGRDEVSRLGTAFNAMASQLKDSFGSLEQRVAARTQDLATVAEVGTATATILESKRLLQEVVDLTKERFNLYHSHIYLLDEKGENLVLTAGAGEPGRIMVAEGRSIPLSREQSLVARAAREHKGVTVNDVTQAPDFLPNPLLPDTRSELAVPMIVAGTVLGVFDIQSDQVGRFTDSDINIQTTLAAQLATSIQNVRSFEQSRKQAELESMVNTIGQKIQRTTSIEETLQTAIRELGTALGASRVKATISAQKDGSNN
jgi:putative methionine-R-sulfoxide reductase with GAF domain